MDRVRDMKAKQKSKAEIEDNRPDSELTEDELAARELLRGNENIIPLKINMYFILYHMF